MRIFPLIMSLVAVSAFAAGVMSAAAASFDCKKAATRVEQAICSDPQLSEMDGALGDVFAKTTVRAAEKGIDRKGMLKMQREWQAVRSEECGLLGKGPRATPNQVACLKRVTGSRI